MEVALRPGVDVAARGGAPVGAGDRLHQVRRHDLAAVLERAVGDGLLERRREQIALPDRHLDVVARLPQRVDRRVGAVDEGWVMGLPMRVRDNAADGAGNVDRRHGAVAELSDPFLEDVRPLLVAVVELIPKAIEERVARDLERLREADDRVLGPPVEEFVVALVVRRLEERRAGPRRAGPDDARHPRRDRGDRLERRAGRIRAGERLVDLGKERVLGIEDMALALVGRHPYRGLVRRIGGHRVDRAGLGVHGDDRAVVGVVLAVGVGGLHPAVEGALRDVLEVGVEGEPHARPRDRLADEIRRSHRLARRVEHLRRLAVRAAQPAVVALLDAGLAGDPGPG